MARPFDHIVLTAPNEWISRSYLDELQRIVQYIDGLSLSKMHIMHDPKGHRVGSGGDQLTHLIIYLLAQLYIRLGGTLNALYLLEQKIGFTAISSSRVLIIHSGGDSRRSPFHSIGGKAFATLNCQINEQKHSYSNPLALLILEIIGFYQHLHFENNEECLVVVASSDVMLDIVRAGGAACKIPPNTVTGIVVPELVQTAKNHGCICVPDNSEISSSNITCSRIKGYFQKPSLSVLEANGGIVRVDSDTGDAYALVDTGVISFGGLAGVALLKLMHDACIVNCTTEGLQHADATTVPLRIELYSELLLALQINGNTNSLQAYHASLGVKPSADSSYLQALQTIHEYLSLIPFHCIVVSDGNFQHLGTSQEFVEFVATPLLRPPSHSKSAKFASKYKLNTSVSSNIGSTSHVLVNSLACGTEDLALASDARYSYIEHSLIDFSSTRVGKYCYLSHVMHKFHASVTDISDSVMIQQVPMRDGLDQYIVVVLGLEDNVKLPCSDPHATYMSTSWSSFCAIAGVTFDDLFDAQLPSEEKTLWTAKLFPVITLGPSTNEIPLLAVWMQCLATQSTLSRDAAAAIAQWKETKRLSLAELTSVANAHKMNAWKRFITASMHYKVSSFIARNSHMGAAASRAFNALYNCAEQVVMMLPNMNRMKIHATILALWSCQLCATAKGQAAPSDDAYINIISANLAIDRDASRSILASFIEAWTAGTAYSSFSRIVLRMCHSYVYEPSCLYKCTIKPLLAYLISDVETKFHARGMLILGWLLRCVSNDSLNLVASAYYHQDSVAVLKEVSRVIGASAMTNASQVSGDEVCLPMRQSIEDIAQVVIFNHIQYSVDQQLFYLQQHINEGTSVRSDKRVHIARAPVRIDLSGGWSDTPDITYNAGGSVLNCSILLDNKYPVTCASCFIEKPVIVLRPLRLDSCNNIVDEPVTCATFHDFKDYRDVVNSSCALLKSVLLVLNVVPLSAVLDSSGASLSEYLLSRYNGGVEVACISTLPAGSGCGGSSIVAAAILKSVGNLIQLSEATTANENLIYLVSKVEQLMATGGGWQDQVGAIFPGFKIGRSLPSLPLTVTVEAIATSAEFNACFQSRCFLLFTGKQRLAKTTLINALRNTALVPQEIPGSYEEYDKNNTISSLVHGAESLYTALTTELQQDHNAVVTKVARHLSDYWRFKQDMGGADTEPVHCTRLFEFLNHHLAGYSLCGAGGGGFACIIVKEGVDEQVIRDSVNVFNSKQETDYQFTVHRVQLDQTGLVAETRELEEGRNLFDFL